MRLYWDANSFIRMVEDDDPVARLLGRLFARRIDGDVAVVTSELTLAELLVVPLREADDVVVRTYRTLFEPEGGIEVISVDRQVLVAAAQIRATNGATKLPDAIHIATCEMTLCTHLISGDAGLPARPLMQRVPLHVDDLAALNRGER